MRKGSLEELRDGKVTAEVRWSDVAPPQQGGGASIQEEGAGPITQVEEVRLRQLTAENAHTTQN